MKTFQHILKYHYDQNPDQVAIYLQHAGQEDKPITYRQLLTHASSVQHKLESEGIQPGEVVLLILQHGEELIYTYFGTTLHGVIPSIMPYLTEKLQPERYREDLASLIQVSQPAAIFTYDEFKPEVQEALSSGTSVRSLLLASEVISASEPTFDLNRRQPQDTFLLQHSSGTTGLQKGVALSHQAVLNQITSYADVLHVAHDDVVVSWLPLYHDMGLIAGFLMPIFLGVPLVLMSPFDWVRSPSMLMHAVSKYKGTISWLPNFAYNFCSQKIPPRYLKSIDLSSWRAVINCSEPMRHKSHQQFLKAFKPYGFREHALATCYGMAENTFAVTQGGIDQPIKIETVDRNSLQVDCLAKPAQKEKPFINIVSAGTPIPNTKVKIIDSRGRNLPERHVGEIAIKSNCMLSEYYNRPDETHEAFQNDWFLTGDYGYLHSGELYITGRKKDIIIIAGKNIYPQDLEDLTFEVDEVHPGRSVAFGIFSEKKGTEEVVIVAETDRNKHLEKLRIAKEIRSVVTRGSAIALRHVHLVNKGWIIKTSSGKTARAANREKFLRETDFQFD